MVVVALLLAGCGEHAAPTRTATPAASPEATATPSRSLTPARRVRGRLPGARAYRACAAAGDFWPTMVLARTGRRTWVACKWDNRLISLDGAQIDLDGSPIAILSAFDALWALDARGTLYEIEDDRVTRTIDLETAAPYNLWQGAGSLWSMDDRTGEVIRIDPQGEVVAKVAVGDGPADMVFDGSTAWIVNHRDRALVSFDTRTNRARMVATLDAEVPERIARLDGALWVTGRGTDLLRVDDRGRITKRVEIGGSGIDVVVAGGKLVVPARSEAIDAGGLPTMEALRRVTPSGKVSSVEPTGRLDVHGLIADGRNVWLVDTTEGIAYRS